MAEWRSKTHAIMTAKLIDQIDPHKTKRKHTVLYTSASTQEWTRELELTFGLLRMALNFVARRLTMNIDDNIVIQDLMIQD
eukprot:4841067-Pyramimonas_sp.AAC.1